MNETLESRIQQVRQRIRRMLWLYGICWVLCVLLGTTLLTGVMDWLIHFDDPTVRLILGLVILGSVGWVSWKYLIAPLMVRFSDVDLAVLIEKRFGGLQDRLSSTVQFRAEQNSPALGSPELQRELVRQTLEQTDRLNVGDIIEPRPVRRAAVSALAVCLLALALVVFSPTEALTGLSRLIFPFADNPWPRRTHFVFVDSNLKPAPWSPREPGSLARGDTLELFVLNNHGALPEEAVIEYRVGEETVRTEPLRKTQLKDEQNQPVPVFVARLLVTEGPFQFRAVGDDHLDMSWHTLDVVPPPQVEELQLQVAPPAYSLKPGEELTQQLPPNVGHVKGLVGTKVSLAARVNKPLDRALLRIKNNAAVPLPLDEDGTGFSATFTISEAGPQAYSYWFELVDRDGFTNVEPTRYDIRGLADTVPDVQITQPRSDLQVTPQAVIPLEVKATDDLGLQELRLRYKLNESDDASRLTISLAKALQNTLEKTAGHSWELTPLNLPVGTRVVYLAEATDYFNLGPEHVGRSQPQALLIVTPSEKAAELANRQAGLLEELNQVQTRHRQAADQTGELQIQLENVGQLRPQDLDLLKSLEYEHQHQIWPQLVQKKADQFESLEFRIQDMLRQIDQNQLQAPEMRQRLSRVAEELKLLKEKHLPTLAQNFNQAIKHSTPDQNQPEAQPDPSSPLALARRQSLEQVRNTQNLVGESLEEMHDQLSDWQYQQDITGTLRNLINEQETLNKDSAEQGKETLGKPLSDLTPQQRADLARLGNRQRKQAAQLKDFETQLEQLKQKLTQADQATSELVDDTLNLLHEQLTDSKLRDAATELENNNIGQAGELQRQALEQLRDIENLINNQGVNDTETLIKKLKQAEDKLELLRQKQEDLLKKQEQAEQLSQPEEQAAQLQQLKKEQRQLREETERLARELRRLQKRQPQQSLQRAAENMQRAEGNQQPEAREEALEDLKQAERELAREREEAEEQLAREALARIADELPGLIKRQESVTAETQRLEAERAASGRWSRSQLKSLRDLVDVQNALRTDTENLRQKIATAEVLALALEGATRQMERSAAKLDARETGPPTVAVQESAKRRIQSLLDVLHEQQQARQQPQQAENPQQPKAQQNGPPGEAIPPLAQLKLLRTLQQDVNDRTLELSQSPGSLTLEQSEELADLVTLQGKLATLVRNMLTKTRQPFEVPAQQPEPQPDKPAKPESSPEAKDEFEGLIP